ncbi:MAG: transposase [Candidatus Altiarchaeia archaeon]
MKGLEIAERAVIKQTEKGWSVPSQNGNGTYEVTRKGNDLTCTCPDCEMRGAKCKHQWAVEQFFQRKRDAQGNITVTKIVRKTYPQNWKAYTAAQNSEIELFDQLLSDLVSGVTEPEQLGAGRRRIPINDLLFCSIQKVYSQLSSRRAKTLYVNSRGRAQIAKDPNYNSINIFLNRKDLTPILESLLTLSALPLKSVESCFAPDSSGFRTTQFAEYYGNKYRKERSHKWLKAHIMVGTKTNIVTSAVITDNLGGDCTQFAHLVNSTHQSGFHIKEVVADMAYLSRDNYNLIDDIEAEGYIPFQKSRKGRAAGSPLYHKMYHYFQLNREDFLKHYHQRSNVETAFHMIKAKFGDKLKSKNEIAQKNELLCKLIAHNIVVLIHEMHELGIKPDFKGLTTSSFSI